MAICDVRGPSPTASEIALAMRVNSWLSHVTRQDVLAAAKLREVPVVNGRVDRSYVADLYFGLCDLFGIKTKPTNYPPMS